MPLCPQITITPVTVTQNYAITAVSFTGSTATYTAIGNPFAAGNQVVVSGLVPATFNGTFTVQSVATNTFTVSNTQQFAVSNVTYTATTATYTASGHNYVVGQSVTTSGLAPAGYNGTFTITAAVAGSTFTVANGTNAVVTDANGSVINAAVTDQNGTASLFVVSSVIAANAPATTEQVNAADAAAAQAVADAAAAQATAAAAQASAATAYDTAVAANTAASAAQTTANGKNKVTYSTSAPGSTANSAGDIWFRYGTSAPNVGRIIAQYSGAGGTSWTQTTVSGLVIANIDAGSITTGTLSVGLGITTGTGTFTVNAVTGALFADSATIKGQVSATSGYFGTATDGFSITSTGLVGIGSGVIIGGSIATAASGTRITLNASGDNQIKIYPDASLQPGYIAASSVSGTGSLRINGPYTSGWNNSNIQLYSLASTTSYIQLTGDVVSVLGGFTVSAGSIFSGSAQFSSSITYPGAATASGSTLVLVSTGSRIGYISSSRKTKKNITPLVPGDYLNKVLSLEPSSFDWLDQPEDMPYRRNYGLMAEDTYEIPEIESVVNLDQDGNPITISYDRLTPFLVMAIKELTARLEALGG